MREQLRTSSPLLHGGPIDTIGQDRIGWSVLASAVVCVIPLWLCSKGFVKKVCVREVIAWQLKKSFASSYSCVNIDRIRLKDSLVHSRKLLVVRW